MFRFSNNKTKLEKTLICCVIVLCLVVITLFICFLTTSDSNVCNDPQCIHAAAHILDTVDPEADPCEDFDQFACGNFMKNALINEQPSTLSTLSKLSKNQLRNIIQEDRKDEASLPRTLVSQRRFYRACMNTTAIDEDKDKTMLELLGDVLGGWPVLKMFTWRDSEFEWSKAMVKARGLGLYHQFFFDVVVFESKGKGKLWIKPLSTEDDPFFQWTERSVEIIAEIAAILGAESVSVRRELMSTLDFADQLHKITAKARHNRSSATEGKHVAVKNLKHKFIKIDWYNFLRNLTGIPLTEDEEVKFDVDDYFSDLYYLLLRTPKKIQANYMAWAIISTNIPYMSEAVRKKYEEISKLSNNTEVGTSTRSETCIKLSLELFKVVAESEYIRRYTSNEKKAYIREMITYIKKEMEESLKVTPWIDDESRANTLKQLTAITEAIGWLDVVFSADEMDKLHGFDKLSLTSNNVLDMARGAMKANFDNYFAHLRINLTEFFGFPSVDVNAYFARQFNILILPASILQSFIFDVHRPQYMNYGALGSIIGHELTHGFSISDDMLESERLWSNGSIENFENVSRCLLDEYQYFQREVGDIPSNNTMVEENLADFTGINLAYTAYQNWAKKNGREKSLPGIRYTPNQMFWIMASTYMCYDPRLAERDDIHKKDGSTGSHGLPVFRLVGRLRNSPYFAKDFNCPEGSKMNRKEKCRIYW